MNELLPQLVARLNKEAKAHSVTAIGTDITLDSYVPFGIPTMIPQLDLSIGRPGWPVGRSAELFGFEATGKTTAGLHAMASAQRMGAVTHFLDSEKCWDADRARQCGVDPDNVMVSDVDSIEAMFRTIENVLDALEGEDVLYLAVVDSVTGVLSEHELDKEIGEEPRVGQDARTIRIAMRKLTTKIAERNAVVLFVNHATEKINSLGWGEQSQAAGGHAIKLFSSVRASFGFVQQLFDKKGAEKEREGQISKIMVKKNKVSKTGRPDFRVELTANGFDLDNGLLEAFRQIGLMEDVKKGVYHFKPAEATVTKKTWPKIVEERGGSWEMYKYFLKVAQEMGHIKPYGTVEPVEKDE